MTTTRSVWPAALLLSVACGSNDPSARSTTGDAETDTSSTDASSNATSGSWEPSSGAGGADGTSSTSANNTSANSTSATQAGAGGASATSTGTGAGGASPMPGMADVGTLVVLGDSISDGGGQAPFYYDVLRKALESHYGHPIGYQKRAQSGSKTSALVGQIDGLPKTLAGPVAVTITSGGNDLKDNLPKILLGVDGPARTQMGNNIDAALTALLAPGRFGANVQVEVFYANIYDASDGKGNYKDGGCVVKVNSPNPVDGYFASWDGEIAKRVSGKTQTLADLHARFFGHGFNHPPKWYANDCTHPNSMGHGEISQMFGTLITGKP